jgi:hypothetical protein
MKRREFITLLGGVAGGSLGVTPACEALTPQRSTLVDHEMKQLPLRVAGLMVG